MVDTQRTVAQLISTLADNTTGDITPQDARDLLVTLEPGHAQIFLTAPAVTSIATQSAFQKLSGTTALATTPPTRWSMPADNQLQCDADARRVVKVTASFSVQTAVNSQTLLFRFAKNGTTISDTEINRFFVLSTENAAVTLVATLFMDPGDNLELWGANDTSTANFTVTRLVMAVIDGAT